MSESTAAGDRRLRLDDLARIRTVTQVGISPDGRRAVCAVQEHLKKADKPVTNLWLVDLAGGRSPHRLTRFAGSDRSPRWSPDGRRVAFLSARPDTFAVTEAAAVDAPGGDTSDKGEPRAQVWCLDLDGGGEAAQLTHWPEGVEGFAWSPDGDRLALALRTPDDVQAGHLKALRDGKEPHVIDRVQHKFDGTGFYDDVRTHLHVLDVAGGTLRQVTDGPASETDPDWSPDGRQLVFLSNRTGDADNNNRRDVWTVDIESGAVQRLTRGDVQAQRPVFSPDGLHVAALVNFEPENSYALDHVAVLSLADAQPVADLGGCIGEGWSTIGGVVPDDVGTDPVEHARRYPVALERTPCRVPSRTLDRPMLGPIVWLDGSHLLTLAGDRGQTRLVGLALTAVGDGTADLLYPFDRGVSVEGMDCDGGRVAVILAAPDRGREVAALDVAQASRRDGPAQVCTDFFAPLLADRDLAPYRRIAFTDHDGVEIEGLVALPPGFDPEHPRPAPLLVSIHGGPMAYDAPGFRFEKQYWAAQGYLVLMVNYRGSISYGEAFCKSIRGDWGPREHDDVMSGVDHLLAMGWADPERLFVTGFSQGGIMTNWAIGHTDRFRAAVSEHGMWDYAAAFGTDDCHLWWQDDLGLPWQNPDGYRRISPSSGVANVRTPVLIMAGAEDWRCPLDQSELMYMALKKRGVDTRLVIYPGEHHAVTKPSRALDRLGRITQWLSAHGGQAAHDAPGSGA